MEHNEHMNQNNNNMDLPHQEVESEQSSSQSANMHTTPPQSNTYSNNTKQHKSSAGFGKLLLAALLGSGLTVGAMQLPNLINSNHQSELATPIQVDQKTSGNNVKLADMIEQVSPAVVGVINMQQANSNIFDILKGHSSSEETPAGTGSGVIYQVTNDEAFIVTNNHVVEGAKDLKVRLSNGKTVDGQLIGKDALTDIAVLKIKGQYNIKPIAFADSSKIRVGDTVYAIGNPLGIELSGSVTEGIVSAKERTMKVETSAGESSVKAIQTDAAINPGNSGGALINNQGQLIGINTLKIASDKVEGLGFAIPSNDTKVLIEKLVKDGKVVRPFMGLALVSVNAVPTQYLEEMKIQIDHGALVASADSVAGKVFKEGDVITRVDGQDVQSDSDIRNYIYKNKNAGDTVQFKIMRNGNEKEVSLKLRSTEDK
ncbi:S1C family serine protease [Macrococcus capreoli]|uniref:S1C family serine protease n=1 Tax=Macrococcus capreoli TaxID=2982690 RepID=UPI0021D57665|nr:S1C family serine protease [Macrococcus sp. TMW 2.2395]MCU7558289.1 S1C family serine protease [Macrococcus sp. TMW 2.2395]